MLFLKIPPVPLEGINNKIKTMKRTPRRPRPRKEQADHRNHERQRLACRRRIDSGGEHPHLEQVAAEWRRRARLEIAEGAIHFALVTTISWGRPTFCGLAGSCRQPDGYKPLDRRSRFVPTDDRTAYQEHGIAVG